MPGRKNPEMTESERKREYRLMQKRGHGDAVVGDRGASLEGKGAVGEIQREREAWAKEHERPSP